MRKFLVIAVFALVTVAMLAPPVLAQAPAPKVTITGLFDQTTSASSNVQDASFGHTSDKEWYATTRFRPDFTFEVGRTKAVMGLEIDLTYGQTSPCSGGPGKVTRSASCQPLSASTVSIYPSQHAGDTANAGLNTDVTGVIEMKWMYTEFDLTGKDSLLPFIPVPTVSRAGLQPFADLANYKVTYANGDFPGLSTVTTFAPNLKVKLAYVMVEDEIAGSDRTDQITTAGGPLIKTSRGNDFAFIISPEYTVYKGLDIKPLYSLFYAEGATTSTARRCASDVHISGGTTCGGAAFGNDSNINGSPAFHENRHTLGVDASWRLGPWGLDPTIYFQTGTRDVLAQDIDGKVKRIETKMNAWLLDAIGSYQMGPLLLEVRGVYSTGNKAKDNLSKRISYFEPLDLDTSYYNTWTSILGLGVDYKSGCSLGTIGMCTNVGYDRYGRAQLGFRATYAVTPAFSVWGAVNPTWTAEKVDTDTAIVASSASTTSRGHITGDMQGDDRYIGTESSIGLIWKFAPNVDLQWSGAWLSAGKALDATEVLNNVPVKRKADDALLTSARVRFAF